MQKKGPARGQPALSSKLNARGALNPQYENDIRGNAILDSVDPFGPIHIVFWGQKYTLVINSTPTKRILKYLKQIYLAYTTQGILA